MDGNVGDMTAEPNYGSDSWMMCFEDASMSQSLYPCSFNTRNLTHHTHPSTYILESLMPKTQVIQQTIDHDGLKLFAVYGQTILPFWDLEVSTNWEINQICPTRI
jgi:hypothetical protein